MNHLARISLWVISAALLWALAGCASFNPQKGFRHYKPDDVATAVRELKPLAEQGNAEAQFNLGSLYYQGWGVPQDQQEAVRWMVKAAEQGHLSAQAALGALYAEGVRGVIEKDYPYALMWLVFAAAQGDPEAMEVRDAMANRMTPAQIAETQRLVREFKPQNDDAKALAETRRLAEQGESGAQFRLGLIHYQGQKVPRDYRESLGWFRKAALQGHLPALYNVGYMSEKGEGTPQDYREAAAHYRRAAERGHELAQYSLGFLYEKGLGVPQDEVQALMWYNLAAVQGEKKARAARDRITIWMNPSQIAEAQRLARDFKAAGR